MANLNIAALSEFFPTKTKNDCLLTKFPLFNLNICQSMNESIFGRFFVSTQTTQILTDDRRFFNQSILFASIRKICVVCVLIK